MSFAVIPVHNKAYVLDRFLKSSSWVTGEQGCTAAKLRAHGMSRRSFTRSHRPTRRRRLSNAWELRCEASAAYCNGWMGLSVVLVAFIKLHLRQNPEAIWQCRTEGVGRCWLCEHAKGECLSQCSLSLNLPSFAFQPRQTQCCVPASWRSSCWRLWLSKVSARRSRPLLVRARLCLQPPAPHPAACEAHSRAASAGPGPRPLSSRGAAAPDHRSRPASFPFLGRRRRRAGCELDPGTPFGIESKDRDRRACRLRAGADACCPYPRRASTTRRSP